MADALFVVLPGAAFVVVTARVPAVVAVANTPTPTPTPTALVAAVAVVLAMAGVDGHDG